jgi:hypothetical protein
MILAPSSETAPYGNYNNSPRPKLNVTSICWNSPVDNPNPYCSIRLRVDQRLGPFTPFAFTRQNNVPTGKSITGVYVEVTTVLFTTMDVNAMFFDTWMVYPLAPAMSAQSNPGLRLVVEAPSAGVTKVGGAIAVRKVRTSDQAEYSPAALYERTRQ